MPEMIRGKNGDLLHVILRAWDEQPIERYDVCDEAEFLQVARIKPKRGTQYPAHKHITNKRNVALTQECWVVMRGSVRAHYYDSDGRKLRDDLLTAGDVSVTLRGGHAYEIVEENTLVIEVKNGPYVGRDADKREIEAVR